MTRDCGHGWGASAIAAAAAALVVTLGESAAQPASEPARRAFMQGHFAEAIALHDAIVRGDVETARAQASQLAVRKPDVAFPTGAHAFFGLMGIEAGKVQRAKATPEMASAAATLLTRCGQCHEAMHVRVAVPVTPETAVGGVVGSMVAHQRAADRLLEGLVGPSTSAWAAGARSLADLRVEPDDLPGRTLRERARIAHARLSTLSAEAARATRPPERAQVYGRLLAVCAQCHRGRPSVGGPRR